MLPGARYLSNAYANFLETCAARQNPGHDESCALFEAWLERHNIPTSDFSDTEWVEFLESQGVTDADAQFDYLERIAEWGGIITRRRSRPRTGARGARHGGTR